MSRISDILAETTIYEFKQVVERSKPKSWLKSVSAFANSSGGTLFFGIDNNGHITGLDNIQSDAEYISEQIKVRLDPIPDFELSAHMENGNPLLKLKVQTGVLTPYYYYYDGSRTAFVRVGNESVLATATQLNNLVLKGRNITYDSLPTEYHPGDFTFRVLANTYKKQTNRNFDEKLLQSFGFIAPSGNLTNSGLLFADNCPLRHSRLFCTRWNGNLKGSIADDALDDKEYQGNLIDLLRQGVEFIANNSKRRWRKTATGRINKPDYAERAVFEALVNALIHRDYSVLGSEVHIDMYDNRLVISSPGGMFDGTLIQNRNIDEVPSSRRNPVLADVFAQLNYMEKRGSGLRKICNESAKLPGYTVDLEPRFKSEATVFFTEITNMNWQEPENSDVIKNVTGSTDKVPDEVPDEVPDKVPDKITTNQEKMLFEIRKNKYISMSELSEKIGISKRKVLDNINKLRQSGLLERIGNNKTGHWEVGEE
ncbi:MAG: ATP-binding protein [Bacteroidales bacterium]|nr:ATP-binding protein [Bacteroidales bacterium]